MSLKPKDSFKMRVRKLKTEDRNKNYFKSEYEGHIRIRNPQQIYLKTRKPNKK